MRSRRPAGCGSSRRPRRNSGCGSGPGRGTPATGRRRSSATGAQAGIPFAQALGGGLAAAVEVLLEVTDAGGELTLDQVWESIEAVVLRRQLRESVDAIADLVPPPAWTPTPKRGHG